MWKDALRMKEQPGNTACGWGNSWRDLKAERTDCNRRARSESVQEGVAKYSKRQQEYSPLIKIDIHQSPNLRHIARPSGGQLGWRVAYSHRFLFCFIHSVLSSLTPFLRLALVYKLQHVPPYVLPSYPPSPAPPPSAYHRWTAGTPAPKESQRFRNTLFCFCKMKESTIP